MSFFGSHIGHNVSDIYAANGRGSAGDGKSRGVARLADGLRCHSPSPSGEKVWRGAPDEGGREACRQDQALGPQATLKCRLKD